MSAARIRVLVVDDSAFARKVMREILSAEPDIEVVGIARDGLDALEKIDELAPDVITLDLLMPALDGIGVLEGLASRPNPPHVIVVSTVDDASPLGVAALAAGAFDAVQKPTAIATDRLYELGAELVAKVRAAAAAPRVPLRERRAVVPALADGPIPSPSVDLVVIGASTGGPQAIASLLRALPASFPVPIAIAIHMPEGYTAAYADRVDRSSALDVQEARDSMSLGPGCAVVARAGMQLKIERRPSGCVARLDIGPLDTAHRPSVDVLFASAAQACGSRLLGVVLTGMGSDGLEGSRAIHTAGGQVIVEAESSCVVYGMPRAVWEAGVADAQTPLEAMARTLLARVA